MIAVHRAQVYGVSCDCGVCWIHLIEADAGFRCTLFRSARADVVSSFESCSRFRLEV